MLEGSVRRAGDQLRVNAQLIDATTGGHVWADKFDGKTEDIFAVQDEFVLKIVEALTVKLTDREKDEIEEVDTDKIEAREAFQKGWELYSRFNAQDNAKAVGHFERAIELDPQYGRAHGALALVYNRAVFFGWFHALGTSEAEIFMNVMPPVLNKAREHPTALVHVIEAMKHMNHWYYGEVEGTNRGTDDARREAGLAIALQPNDPEAHITMAWALIASGKPAEGLNFVKSAMRLNPNYPSHYVYFDAAARYALGDLNKAADILKIGMKRDSRATVLAPLAASIYAQLDRRREAHEGVRKWQPNASQTVLREAAERYIFPIRFRWTDGQLERRLEDGLQLAALPLDVTINSLSAGLKSNTQNEQLKTIRALGWFGPAAAAVVLDLIELLDSERGTVRKEAIITLGKIGPKAKAAIPALKAIQDMPLIGIRAKRALKMISG